MALQARTKDLCDAVIAWWTPYVSSLSLASFDWDTQMVANQSVAPCNPRTECPRAVLRLFRNDDDFAASFSCPASSFVLNASIFLQLRQTPGQAHQELLAAALDTFATPLLQAKFIPDLGLSWLSKLKISPLSRVIYDEIKHPLGDPTLTVSVGELNLTMIGELS